MLWREKIGCWPMDTILRPPSFKYAHRMIIKRLMTYVTPLGPLHITKTMVPGANFGRFDVGLDSWLDLAFLGLILGSIITWYVTNDSFTAIVHFESWKLDCQKLHYRKWIFGDSVSQWHQIVTSYMHQYMGFYSLRVLILLKYKHRQVLCTWNHEN